MKQIDNIDNFFAFPHTVLTKVSSVFRKDVSENFFMLVIHTYIHIYIYIYI